MIRALRHLTALTATAAILISAQMPVRALAVSTETPPQAQTQGIPNELKDVGITEHLGDSLLLQDLTFKNEEGKDVELKSYFNQGKPVLLVFAYYECPNLCTLVLNGLVESLKKLDWTPGKQFEIVTLSIDPKEDAELAKIKKEAYMTSYGKTEAAPGWHFLTGKEDQIKKLASAAGFGYKYDPTEKQYAHSAALIALTPDGRVSRYLYGIEYQTKDMKLALLEASNGKIGTVIERFLLFCYRYDPKTRKYSVYLTRLMQTGAAGTILVFGGYLTLFWRRQRRLFEKEPNSNV